MFRSSRHVRFLWALALGAAIALVTLIWPMSTSLRALLAVNGFFLAYLTLMLKLALQTTPEDLRRHAEADDEGIVLILLLALGAVIVSLSVIFGVLNAPIEGALVPALALLAVPLGWAMMHTLAAFRYAHLYYARKPAGGLAFADTPKPGVWEFLYLAFGVGMTAQVADTAVTDTGMRQMILVHSVASFFYNTVILALAVNAGISLGS